MFAFKATRLLPAVASAAIVALALCSPAWAWAWPADGPVLRGFSVSGDVYAAGQHRGIDVALGTAPAFRAPVSGSVTFAGSTPANGLTVTISADEYKATLTHLGQLHVRRGQTVTEGDVVAEPGPTGEAEYSVPYAHLGIRVGDTETYVDPLELLPPRGVSHPPTAPEAPPAPEPPTSTSPPGAATVPAPSAPVAQPDPTPTVEPGSDPVATISSGQEVPSADSLSVQASASPTTGIRIGASAKKTSSVARKHAPARRRAESPRPAPTPAGDQPVRQDDHERRSGRATTRLHALEAIHPRAHRKRITSRSDAAPLVRSTDEAPGPKGSRSLGRWVTARPLVLLLAVLFTGGAALGALRVGRKRLPIIGAHVGDAHAAEDPGCGRVAVRERAPSHRPCGGVRSSVGHVCALPPTSWERRTHGQRDRRARDARHGRGRRRRRVTA